MCKSAPSAPALPQYPDLTDAEKTNLGQQAGAAQDFGNVISSTSGQLGQNTDILQTISGLFNPDGSINQDALTQLQTTAKAGNTASSNTGIAAMNAAGSTLMPGGSFSQTDDAYKTALAGGAPANKQIGFQQKQNFQQMQQQAAAQGIKITGDSFANAVSNSTAGQKLIQNFQQNANIQNQNYDLGYLSQLTGNMGQIANSAATNANTGTAAMSAGVGNPLNLVSNSISQGQSALAPLLSSYQQSLVSGYQPLYMQQIGPYQQQMAQAQANYQAQMNQANTFNQTLSGYLNPLGGAAGSMAGSMGGLFGGGTAAAGGAGAAGGVSMAGDLGAAAAIA